MIQQYQFIDEFGELPYAREKSSGKFVKLSEIPQGSIIDFDGKEEVVIRGHDCPLWSTEIATIRRGKDQAIEMVRRGQAGQNQEGAPFWTLKKGVNDYFGGYDQLNVLLEKVENDR